MERSFASKPTAPLGEMEEMGRVLPEKEGVA